MTLPNPAFLFPTPIPSSHYSTFLPPTTSPLRPFRYSNHVTPFNSPTPFTPPPSVSPTYAVHNSVSYPTPETNSISRTPFIRTCPSIPSVISKMADDPAFADTPCLIDEHHGDSVHLNYLQVAAMSDNIAASIKALGLRPRDVVSLFSENSYRWLVTDLAIMKLGAASAVRGVDAPVPELKYIYSHSRSVALVAENVNLLDKLVAKGLDTSKIKFVIVLFGTVEAYHGGEFPVFSFDDIMHMGKEKGGTLDPAHGLAYTVERDDVATVLFTSGTTGYPKGVALTHGNLLSQLEDISLGELDPRPGMVFVSVLPCWHVFERTAAFWCLSKGVTLVYSNRRRFRDDLSKHRPHLLISVPRVFENLHATIMSKLKAASELRRALFGVFFALSLAFVRARRRLFGLGLGDKKRWGLLGKVVDLIRFSLLMPLHFLAEKIIWSKLRQRLGGRLKICLSGGGSLAGYLEDFFECAGIVICVGYGLTETSPVIANRFGSHNVRGTTGMPLPQAYVKIVNRETGKIVEQGEQGNLFVAGPYVFSGYLKDPEATAKAFDSEGYFNTGDLAYNTPDGDVVIAGRSKDVIVLSNGENIEPGPIEDALLASPLVDQVMLVGQDEKALAALVVPKLDFLEKEGLLDAGYRAQLEKLVEAPEENAKALRKHEKELLNQEGLRDAFRKDIKKLNEGRPTFSSFEGITNFRLILVPFTVENGMATQTLKIKKQMISKVYQPQIADIYRRTT